MKKLIFSFIYRYILGWKKVVLVPDYDKCVMCVAPHTSNWDLLFGKIFYNALGRKASFMMKKEWFFFPLGMLFKGIGGIPVDRGRKTSLVDQMVENFKKKKRFHLAITPEGTRKANSEWKKGFYFIAMKAQVPIILIGIDYPSKTITVGKAITPSGDFEKDLNEIKLYFKDFKGKKPENFSLGKVHE
ncbi:acyltransferase [Bacteroidaceae bacterium HV4-6-C5C]|jgi:1-acyl-sn-glycerol-3-phosphate acyltransferase|nr:acyltransferase [Bacteroidaceae bacterium HV4-6-C5C]